MKMRKRHPPYKQREEDRTREKRKSNMEHIFMHEGEWKRERERKKKQQIRRKRKNREEKEEKCNKFDLKLLRTLAPWIYNCNIFCRCVYFFGRVRVFFDLISWEKRKKTSETNAEQFCSNWLKQNWTQLRRQRAIERKKRKKSKKTT